MQIFTDTITLNVLATVKPNLGPDQTLCAGESYMLDAGSGYSFYQWSTGSFNQVDTIDVNGNYIVETIDSNSCSTFDTIQVSFISLPPFTLGPDIQQCDTSPITLNSPGILQWTWSDGSTDTTLTVDTSGIYFLVFTNGPNFTSYLWQDGTISEFYIALSSAPATIQYSVTVVDINGCPTSDDVIVDFQICPSTNDFEFEKSLTIYPNPVQSSSSLLIDSKDHDNVSIELFSTTGKKVFGNLNQTLPARISTNKISASQNQTNQ